VLRFWIKELFSKNIPDVVDDGQLILNFYLVDTSDN